MIEKKIFQPFTFRGYCFKNRFGMSALTRRRCDLEGTPDDVVKQYYTQRARSIGFMSTECMPVNDYCCAWPNAGVLYTQKATEKWRDIVTAVHQEKCIIFAQLFHGGRTVHPHFGKNQQPVAPSPLRLPGNRHTPDNLDSHAVPKEMTLEDIQTLKIDFKISILNAVKAGFDGIEFHSANGYLLDEFLRSVTNQRTDQYGGSIENRARLLLELVEMAKDLIGPDRIGVKITPVGRMNSMYDENPQQLLEYLLPELDKRGILYVVIGSAEDYFTDNNGSLQMKNVVKDAKKLFKNGLVITDGYESVEERIRRVEDGEADIANFGKLLIANPNFPHQLLNDLPYNPLNQDTLYKGGPSGYTDYPFIQ
jgi:2,4-dienoyl-CoA reductase-like NADH-dependent reductase (Old Yellow Enzyme family)